MKILIIEDEPATAKRLKKIIEEVVPDASIVDILDTVERSVHYFKNHAEPELVFMDIHLADGISFEIFDQINLNCPVIFTTAYDQYAIKAFKVNSIDYLLKPIKREELVASMNKFRKYTSSLPSTDYRKIAEIIQQQNESVLERIVIRIGRTIKAIQVADVAYFFVDNKIVYGVTFKGNQYPVDFTMAQLEADLNSKRFFRINRSFIISFESIDTMMAYSKSRIKITLNPPCDQEALTSSDRSSFFKEWLKGN